MGRRRPRIDEIIAAETSGLSESSVERRGSAIRTWLALLPEVEVRGTRSSKTYVYVGDGNGQSSSNAFRD